MDVEGEEQQRQRGYERDPDKKTMSHETLPHLFHDALRLAALGSQPERRALPLGWTPQRLQACAHSFDCHRFFTSTSPPPAVSNAACCRWSTSTAYAMIV